MKNNNMPSYTENELAQEAYKKWLAWIAVDVVSCGLYVYKGLDFTAFLYGLYAVIAIFGYFKWKKMLSA